MTERILGLIDRLCETRSLTEAEYAELIQCPDAAPLLAEHVAALALGAPSPLPRGLSPAGD